MTIIKNDNTQKAYKGDYGPLNVYKGSNKMTGWKNDSKSGSSVSFVDTYNDVADVTVDGETVQVSDWYGKDGLLTQFTNAAGSAPVSSGLVLDMNGSNFFNDPQSTTLQDRSGNGNTGTSSGFVYTTASGSDRAGGIIFDGTDDFIRRVTVDNDTLDLTGALTLDAWIKPTSLTSTSKYVIAKNNDGGTPDHQFAVALTSSKIEVYMNGVLAYNLTKVLTVGNKIQLVVTWDGATISVYVDNVLAGSTAYSATLPFKPNLSIGCRSNAASGLTGQYFFSGTMFSVKLYNRALTVGEIGQNYTAGSNITTPSPIDASPVVSNLKAGTYKYTSNDGIYEFTLAEDLRGIGTAVDKLLFDRVSHRLFVERKIGKVVLDGTQSFTYQDTLTYTREVRYYPTNPMKIATYALLSDKFRAVANTWGTDVPYIFSRAGVVPNHMAFRLPNEITATTFFTANPTNLYYELQYPTRIEISVTKVASSSATEVPVTFVQAFPATTPSLSYPAKVYDVSGKVKSRNTDSSKTSEATLPTLRKIGTVADSFNPLTGKLIKRISDWVTLDGNGDYTPITSQYLDFKRVDFNHPQPNHKADSNDKLLMLDYTSASVPFGTNIKDVTGLHGSVLNKVPYWISNSKTGWGDMVFPALNEIKAYFHGWQMCNADGTSPYYKSEVPYAASTWAEWTTSGATVTKDSTGISMTITGSTMYLVFSGLALKVSTKYGILYNVISKSGYSALQFDHNYNSLNAITGGISTAIGNNKGITWSSNVPFNLVTIYRSGAVGDSIKIKEIRIFELLTGSQIEADFTNLTADQLVAKYPFNGLCIKNWKKITDGTGQTSTLPTASYAGYEPYKMIYQLATPIETDLAVDPVETFYPTTIIETDAVNAVPNLNATVKVED